MTNLQNILTSRGRFRTKRLSNYRSDRIVGTNPFAHFPLNGANAKVVEFKERVEILKVESEGPNSHVEYPLSAKAYLNTLQFISIYGESICEFLDIDDINLTGHGTIEVELFNLDQQMIVGIGDTTMNIIILKNGESVFSAEDLRINACHYYPIQELNRALSIFQNSSLPSHIIR